MNNQVLVCAHPETGAVVTMREITDSNTGETREVGNVMVQSKTLGNLSGLGRVQTRTAFVTLEQEALDFLGDSLRDNAPFPIEGRIVVQETLEPWVSKSGKKQEPKINPSTNEVITYQGQPVYRNTFFSTTGDQDVFLKDAPVASTEGDNTPE